MSMESKRASNAGN